MKHMFNRLMPHTHSNKEKSGYKRGNDKSFVKTKEFEKKIKTVVQRLAETPQAVDALCFVIKHILDNPNDHNRKQVNTSKPVYFRTIGKSKEWGIRFLELMDFEKNREGSIYALNRYKESREKLLLGLSNLEAAKGSEIYKLEKEKIQFTEGTRKLLAEESVAESQAKQQHLDRLPPIPKEGSPGFTRLRVYFGEEDISREFTSDVTLSSVLDWLCASFHSSLVSKLRADELELIDRTVYPPKKVPFYEGLKRSESESSLDVLGMLNELTVDQTVEEKTLQELGWWPSGELEIQASGFLVRERALNGIKDKEEA